MTVPLPDGPVVLDPGLRRDDDNEEAAQRARVVAEARSWIGTPYHHQADVKGAGVDCGMLLVRVFVDCGIVPPFDPRPYPVHWHLHQDDERYLAFLFDRTSEVAVPGPGDIAMWRFGRTFSHGGVMTGERTCVHAYSKSRIVEESDILLPSALSSARHPRRFFSCWA